MGQGEHRSARATWSNKVDFVMAAVSYAVGLGNIWRFPYLCYRNGGGAFMVPYFIFLFLVAMPLLLQQMAIGQFSSRSSLACRTYSPVFKGLAFYALVNLFLGFSQYNVVISWGWSYLFYSLRKLLPWIGCEHWWNSQACSSRLPEVDCSAPNRTAYGNGTCYGSGGNLVGVWSYTHFVNETGIQRTLASEEYFSNRLLRITSGIEDMGGLHWENVLFLFWSTLVVFACLSRGIRVAGKVSYVLCLLPYAILLVLLVRATMLPGARDGILFFVLPRWEQLADIRVWYDAASQIFYSTGVGGAVAISLASYNDFHNNFLRDTLLVCFFNTFCSLLAGMVVFSFVGFLAGVLQTDIEKVATAGPGLAFVVFPELVTHMPLSPLWSTLFFIVFIMLGLGTALGGVEHMVACISDEVQGLRGRPILVTAIVTGSIFLVGLPMCLQGGVYILQIFDHYLISYGILIASLLDNISVAWVYGARRLSQDCELMLGRRISVWWRLCWQVFCPCLITFILIMMAVNHRPVRYGLHYYYPGWADAIGWAMILVPLLGVPVFAAYKILTVDSGSLLQRVRAVSRPAPEWGPALVRHRRLVTYVEGFQVEPGSVGQEMEKLSKERI